MQHDHKFGHLRLVSSSASSTAASSTAVSRWTPHPLDLRGKTEAADADRRSLNELSIDLQTLSRRTSSILQSLNQAGSPQEQSLFQLTRILEQELAELVGIAQSLKTE